MSVEEAALLRAAVVRSKGWVWLGSRPRDAMAWSHAGLHVEVGRRGAWGGAEAGRDLGAPRQELVFIGRDDALDEAAIGAALDACLTRGDPAAAPTVRGEPVVKSARPAPGTAELPTVA